MCNVTVLYSSMVNCTSCRSAVKSKVARIMKKARQGKRQWFDQALIVLETSGVEEIKIERLARQLNLSRNSFYWHFKNRKDLLDQLIEYWVSEFTNVVIGDEELPHLPAKERLRQVMLMVRENRLARYDLAFNSWAKVDPKIMKAVKQVTIMRCDYLREIYRELGYSGDELEARVKLFVCYNSWQAVMFDPLGNDSDGVQEQVFKLLL